MVKIEFQPIIKEEIDGYPQDFKSESGESLDVANAADVAEYFGA